MIDLRASRLLARHDLAPVAAAEALVLPLLGHYLLCLLLPGDPPLPFLRFLRWWLVLMVKKTKKTIKRIGGFVLQQKWTRASI